MQKILLLTLGLFMALSLLAQDSLYLEQIGLQEKEMESLFYAGKYLEAADIAKSVLQDIEANHGKENSTYGHWSDNVGMMLHYAGERGQALPYLETGVATIRKYLPKDDENYPIFFNNLGMLYRDLGRYGEAINLIKEAAAYGKETYGEDHFVYGIFLNNIGLVFEDMERNEPALEYMLKALEVTEKSVGKEHKKYATRLTNAASLYRQMGQHEKAITFNQEALGILDKALGEQHLIYQNSLINMAKVYNAAHQYEKSLQAAQRAVNLTSLHQGKAHYLHFNALVELGHLYHNMSDYSAALQTFQAAESIIEEGTDISRAWKHVLYSDLSLLHEKLGNISEAKNYLTKATAPFFVLLEQEFDFLSQKDQESILKRYEAHLNHLFSFVISNPDELEMASMSLNAQLLRKELTLGYRKNLLAKLTSTSDEDLLKEFAQWKKLQKNIAKQLSLTADQQVDDLAQIQVQASELERKLASQSTDFREIRQASRWQDMQAVLQEGEAAVEFAHTPFYQNGRLTDSVMYAAFVVRKDQPLPQVIYLFEEAALGNLKASRKLYRPSSTGEEGNLQNLIWKPLSSQLEDIHTIYLAPSGLLHRVNFGAIPCDEKNILSQRYQLHRLGSTRQLINREKNSLSTNEDALVYGGIQYDKNQRADFVASASSNWPVDETIRQQYRSILEDENGWPYLRYSAREAEEVAKSLKSVNRNVEVRSGLKASEDHFKNRMSQETSPALIHIATHGFFFPKPDLAATTGFRAAREPMIRCGLVLAGANAIWKEGNMTQGGEDGILTAYEIAQLNMEQTELVVLSACETGLGDIQKNEGVYGLQRAFKIAGSQYLIMSLWSVPDRQTHEFMTLFYEQWLTKGKDIPTAFYHTQNILRERYLLPFNPSLWAGFILVE